MSNVRPLSSIGRPAAKPIVIALHCSGATGAQWRQLERELGPRFTVIAPDLIGSGATPHWHSVAEKFRMSDEAARIVRTIDDAGTWDAMRPDLRAAFARYIRKAPLEFHAALGERIALHAYRRLNVPTLLLQGELAPEPTRVIARVLAKAMRRTSLLTVYGAGHMGPLSHSGVVSAMMADWIFGYQPGTAAGEHLGLGRDMDQVA